MPDMIRDGSGGGYLAKVDSDNHLHVAANVKSRMAMQAESASKAYSIYGRLNVAAAVTDEHVLFFQYDGNDYFFVDKIVFSASTPATVTEPNAKFELYRNSTYVSGGTAGTPVNTDFSSSLTLSSTVYTGASQDLVATKSSEEIIDVRVGLGSTTVHFDGALILGKANNLHILGESLTIADEMRVMVLGYEGTRE